MTNSSHFWLSAPTRNALIVTQINKENATIDELVAEYGLPWNTIVASLHDIHYHLQNQPASNNTDAWRIYRGNMTRFNNLMKRVAENTRAAQKAKKVAQQPIRKAAPVSAQKPTQKVTQQPVQKVTPIPVQVTDAVKSRTQVNTSTHTSSHNLPLVYLVETGYLLSINFSDLLTKDDGNAVFMIPRFCIKELKRIAENTSDPISSKKANDVLLQMYSEDVWDKKIVAIEPVEQGFIAKTPDIMNYKSRSFGIAEIALEIYLDSNRRVHVLTNSMEIQHLVIRMVKNEGLESEILVTRIYRK